MDWMAVAGLLIFAIGCIILRLVADGGMRRKPKKFAILVILLMGPTLILLLSVCFPWFIFSGTAQHLGEPVEVSGWVSLTGIGTLYRTSAEVIMWSSPTYWSTARSDFWYGYLSILGLIVVLASVIVYAKTDELKTFVLLALIGSSLAISASLATLLHYKPHTFVINGQIDDAVPQGEVSLLYAAQATVNNGLGLWLSFIGGILSVVSCSLPQILKLERRV